MGLLNYYDDGRGPALRFVGVANSLLLSALNSAENVRDHKVVYLR